MKIPIIIVTVGFIIITIIYILDIIHYYKKRKYINQELSNLEKQKVNIQDAINNLEEKKEAISKTITALHNSANQYEINYKEKESQLKEVDNLIQQKKDSLSVLKELKDREESSLSYYSNLLDKSYQEKEQDYDNKCAALAQKYKECESSLEDISQKLASATAAQLREREKEEKEQFYKLYISETDLFDVKRLLELRTSFRNQRAISKLVWSEYFQKQTNEMCNRIFGSTVVCGIYKITNLITKQSYIGQSLNIQDRMKQHIKCGLGIDASYTSMLYTSMQKYGVWNFTFELLESCSKEKLNEREKFYIALYQTDKVGYNMTQGGS